MPDPITTIITTAVEHAPGAVATAAVLKAAKDFWAKVTGPAVEELGEIGRDYVKGWRAKNGNAVLAGANTLLAEAGREPQAVPLKVLLPLLDAASLETDEPLAERWMALLANAADSTQRVRVRPSFVEVLRQLTPTDARVLVLLYQQVEVDFSAPTDSKLLAWTTSFPQELSLTDNELAISIDELARLKLCDINSVSYTQMAVPMNQLRTFDSVFPTVYGTEFLAAVTAPTP